MIRALLVLGLASQAIAGVPYLDRDWGYRLTLPDGWAVRVTAPSSAVRQFGPIGDPDIALILHANHAPRGTPLDVERHREQAERGIQGLNAKLKATEWSPVIPGVQASGWGYNFKEPGGPVQAIRCAAFTVPAGDQELVVRVQATFKGTKAPVVKSVLPELLASFACAATAPGDRDLAQIAERTTCLENQRALTAAVQTLSEEGHGRITSLTPQVMAALESGGFLKDMPKDPWKMTSDGDVTCGLHGETLTPAPQPPLDHSAYRSLGGDAAARACRALVGHLASGLALARKDDPRAELGAPVIETMRRRGWLASVMTLEDPGQGAGSEASFSSKDGVVRCRVHGTASR